MGPETEADPDRSSLSSRPAEAVTVTKASNQRYLPSWWMTKQTVLSRMRESALNCTAQTGDCKMEWEPSDPEYLLSGKDLLS